MGKIFVKWVSRKNLDAAQKGILDTYLFRCGKGPFEFVTSNGDQYSGIKLPDGRVVPVQTEFLRAV